MKLLTKRVLAGIGICAMIALGIWGFYRLKTKNPSSAPTSVTVRFGMLPYGDHTYAIIGAKQGWFNEVGIDLEYRPIKIEEAVPFLLNSSLDTASCPPGVIIAAYATNPGAVSYVFGDMFQGYAIMAQPGGGYKSVSEFMQGGLSRAAAVRATVRQMSGKVFAYPPEAGVKPFVDLSLAAGELTQRDFKPLVIDDPLTVTAMRNHQADFQVGGVPSHIVLEKDGFKPLLTSNDIASAAKPSPDSPELSSIFPDGWACTRKYYEQHKETVLRMASVNFRITRFIDDHPDQAIALHMPYLAQVTGQGFSTADGQVMYKSLDPFFYV